MKDGPVKPREETIAQAIARDHARNEVIISCVLIACVTFFSLVYFFTPSYGGEQAFRPFPYILAVYSPYLLARLILALKGRLGPVTLAASCVIDTAMLTVLIWCYHLQYSEPAPFYLRAPTFLTFYLFIALRALSSRMRYVVLSGVLSIAGWAALVAYARLAAPGLTTDDFVVYANTGRLHLAVEIEKMMSLGAVTTILAFAVDRTRKLLTQATFEANANRQMSRFFSPEIASKIKTSGSVLEAGKGEHRTAAILMMDLRGFTKLSTELPANSVMRLLAEYQARMIAPIFRNGGTIDKFMGDGIMAHFGAASPSTTYAADCLRAVEELEKACDQWNAERRKQSLQEMRFGIACAVGDVIFGAVGDKDRIELTTIGEAVNLAAKLEKHTKEAQVVGITSETTWYRAIDQGYRPVKEFRRVPQSTVAGVPHALNLVVLVERLPGAAAA